MLVVIHPITAQRHFKNVSDYLNYLKDHSTLLQVVKNDGSVKYIITFIPRELRVIELIKNDEKELAEQFWRTSKDEMEIIIEVERENNDASHYQLGTTKSPDLAISGALRFELYFFSDQMKIPLHTYYQRPTNNLQNETYIVHFDANRKEDIWLEVLSLDQGKSLLKTQLPLSIWKKTPGFKSFEYLLK